MDESTDRSDIAQLLIFIRDVDDEFNITEELACLQSIKGKTTGQIIYNEFSDDQNLNALISRLCNITTDGAPNMVGKNAGFSGIFRNQNPNHDVVFLHCIIYQDVHCKAAIDITHVLNMVLKLINTIRSRGLVHRQFPEFLIEVDADYSDLLYYTKVRWLSCGYAFERVWNLKEESQDFLKNKTDKWSDF
ncbi:general transcription factor II-I repeat domain-containing protein 2A [Nephila pilipes]|uniref:General transcription factor II-I repeat domain-containing protein 2A n=1 Tax=Nephila pilipes TaxID=299642 RepID=A0A8X6PZ08_NEPPI|nr:general transcription factor II-I repeat domain-containing protein 2A [Nephila pilipes]